MAKLSAKQKRFCEEYVVDLNGTQAAIRAGYSPGSAKVQGARMLTNDNATSYIQELQSGIYKRNIITADMVIAELAKIALHNVQDFVNGGNTVLELKDLSSEKTAAVSGVKTKIDASGNVTTEIKFHDKVSALEKLGRHLGIFEKDNDQRKIDLPNAFKVEIVQPNDED